ncbi:MAG: MFS transporter, partial [Parvularculaceae bacterium]
MRRAEASYAALYSSKFVSLGIQLPFFSAWLHAKGLSASEIGLATGLALGARLALGPFVALWADRRRDRRTGLRAVAAVFAAASLLLVIAPGKFAITAAAILMLWAFGVLVPLADAAVLREDRAGQLSFGRTRAIGSGAFLITTILGGEASIPSRVNASPPR